jgi:colanic acid biosynthesis glycosyl transferase WcaI
MTPLSISFYSPHFHPEKISTGKYNSLLVKGLLDRGAAVQVITSHPLYPAWRPVRTAEPFFDATIHRGGAWLRYPVKPLLRRALLECWFSWHALTKTFAANLHANIVVVVFPPSLYFLFIHWLLPPAAKKVGIVHDLQGILGLDGGNILTRALNHFVLWIEKKTFRSCEKVIALSEEMAGIIATHYSVDPQKIVVCYPFITIEPGACSRNNLQPILEDGVAHVVYSGALGKKQNSQKLFEFFQAAAREMPSIHFHLFSEGPAFDQLRSTYGAASCSVQLHDLVDEADLKELYARSTIQVLPQVQAASGACFPSKLPNLLAAGVPVLAICDPHSDLASIINNTSAGLVADSWEIPALIVHLRHLLQDANAQSREARQVAVKETLETRFNLDVLLDSILATAISPPPMTIAPAPAP